MNAHLIEARLKHSDRHCVKSVCAHYCREYVWEYFSEDVGAPAVSADGR